MEQIISKSVENLHISPESDYLDEIFHCLVCQTPTRSYCVACCNAFYCSRSHQKKHWKKVHKMECAPVKVVRRGPNDSGSRTLIATKDIPQGKKVLEETPIFITPNTRTENGITCLGCCKKLSPSNVVPCIRCGWPLCGVQCEMEQFHTSNECSLLQEKQVQCTLGILGNSYQTLCEIGVLRMLLLKSKEPETWRKLEELDCYKEARERIPDHMFSVKSIVTFIKEEIGMADVEEDVIDKAFGILRGNAFDASDYFGFIQSPTDELRHASLIFPRAIMPGVNCVPNAQYSIKGRFVDGNFNDFKIYITSTLPIKKGEPISLPYEDEMTGTFLRHRVMESVFFQHCTCPLCSDPSEFGTNISAVKCSQCKTGYLLSTNPTSSGDEEWKCNNGKCSNLLSYLGVMDLVQNAKMELQMAVNRSSLEESLKSVKEVQERLLHPNHFLILKTEFEAVRRILGIIGFHEIKNLKGDVINMLNSLVDMVKHLLEVAKVLRPGLNRTRGRLLYALQFGMLILLLNEYGQEQDNKTKRTSDRQKIRMMQRYQEIRKLQDETETILALEPEDDKSEEHRMLRTLKGELRMAMNTIHL